MSSQVPLRLSSSSTPAYQRHSTPFQYDPLETGHIRLLDLLPRENPEEGNAGASEVIQCKLLHVPLADAGNYEALSYTWGTDERPYEIQMGERSGQLSPPIIKVTRNLFTGLKHLRLPSARKLWIDQLCIDQENTKERDVQVQCMRDIYSKAKRTVVWLGESDEDTTLLKNIYDDVSKLPDDPKMQILNIRMLDQPTLRSLFDIKGLDSDLAQTRRNLMERFLNREWFRRAWVYQEVVVAEEVDVVWGKLNLPLEFVAGLIMSVYSLAKGEDDGTWHKELKQTPGFGPLRAVFYDRRAYQQQKLNFPNILWRGRKYLQATDHRDFVYSFLGFYDAPSKSIPIVVDEPRKRINADYKVSMKDARNYRTAVEKTFTKLARTLILNSGSLDILQFVVPTKRSKYCLPSWVPNWTEKSFLSGSPIVVPGVPNNFRSCRNKRHMPISSNPRELHVKGHVLSRIHTVIPRKFKHSYFNSSLKDALQLDSVKDLVNQEFEQFPEDVPVPDWISSRGREVILQTVLADGSFSSEKEIKYSIPDLLKVYDEDDGTPTDENVEDIKLRLYLRLSGELAAGKRVFLTDHGDIGLGYCTIREGDLMCILYGCQTPCVLRISSRVKGCYKFVGQCYLHEWMVGNTNPRNWEWWEEDPETFMLV